MASNNLLILYSIDDELREDRKRYCLQNHDLEDRKYITERRNLRLVDDAADNTTSSQTSDILVAEESMFSTQIYLTEDRESTVHELSSKYRKDIKEVASEHNLNSDLFRIVSSTDFKSDRNIVNSDTILNDHHSMTNKTPRETRNGWSQFVCSSLFDYPI